MSSCEYEFTVTRSVETKLGMAGVFVFSGNGSQCATSATTRATGATTRAGGNRSLTIRQPGDGKSLCHQRNNSCHQRNNPCRRRNRGVASARTRERAGCAGDDDDFAVVIDDLTVAVETSGRRRR